MWNTFENSKTALERESCGKTFTANPVWISAVTSMIENDKSVSLSVAKARAIAHILETAELHVCSEDIFVHEINHCQIMQEFTWNNKKTVKAALRDSLPTNWLDIVAFRANMDFGHIAPDWQYLLRRGITGVIEDLQAGMRVHAQEQEKVTYYLERIMVYEAIRTCFLRFADIAAARKTEKGNFIAENMQHLALGAPETLAQAMQLLLLFYVIQTKLDTVIVRSLGGLDRMLYSFYKQDLAEGIYTNEQLAEITKYFLWNISCMNVEANLPFYICGMDDKGVDATNEFTSLLLNAYRKLDIYDPKIHVMYHDAMDKTVLRLVLEMIAEGKNSFVFMNTAVASGALERIGIAPEDAKRVIPYGCYETAAEGKEVPCTCGGMINMAKSVELALNGGKKFATFEAFYEEVIGQLEAYTTACMDTISTYELHYMNVCPSLVMSPTYELSRESGVDVYMGGAKYNNTSIVGAGLATLTDSLVAVRKLVFEEQRKSLGEFNEILLSNWEKDPKLRLLVKTKYPKFGNNDPEADLIANDIYMRFSALINGRKNGRGGVFRCGMFSVDWRFWMGEATGATPDGRMNGEPLSKNLTASLGQDKNGVTAYLNSLLKLDAEECPDGYVADVVLHCSAVKDQDGMDAFEGLLLTFMNKGGFAVHFNILSPDTLVNAQKEPEKYQNLQIRLCGWNVRFVELDKAQQDEFIKQAANVM